MSLPPLPQHVSNDGREIWDWAARISQRTSLLQHQRELTDDIFRIGRECGSCRFWMTDACPREVQDNRIGRKRGPSMGAPICQKFAISDSNARLKAKWEADLAVVRNNLCPRAPNTQASASKAEGGEA